LINNRQGGRRRGRGGQNRQNLGGQAGNRQDNRQRGNAAQLLEKYKSMARDAQLAGDRVQTEHYLQFADHYFRVLSESRSRFEDQNPRRQRDDDSEDDEDELMEAGEAEAQADDRPEREERQDRAERFSRRGRPRSEDREDRGASQESEEQHVNGETIPFDALPPAIGRDDRETSADEEPRRPRARRSRAARPDEGEEEAAPAA
jgi:uncharacterized protein DUF4167